MIEHWEGLDGVLQANGGWDDGERHISW
jgi:hypothetical protein